MWRPKVDTPFGDKDGRKVKAQFVGYLIDGQQRLTSLEGAFALSSVEDNCTLPCYREGHGLELRCFVDLAVKDDDENRRHVTRLFVSYGGNKSIKRRVDDNDPSLVPIAKLFEGQDMQFRKETEEALQRRDGWDATRIHEALERLDQACLMLNQLVPCTTVRDVEDKVAVEVFSRLNKGGATLGQADVQAADLACDSASVDALEKMRNFVSQDRPQRLGFGFSFAFRALVVFHRGNAKFTDLKPDWLKGAGPYGRSLTDSWHATEKAIGKALEFADQQMGWSRRALLPSANALIVLAAAFDKADFKLGGDAEQLYRQWLCLTALRGVFRGAAESTINSFLRKIQTSKQPPAKALVEALKRHEKHPVRSDEFLKPTQQWGPATQVMHAYFVGQEAKDWRSGDFVDVWLAPGIRPVPVGI